MNSRRMTATAVLLISLASGLAGCGDGDDKGAGPSDPPATSQSSGDTASGSPSSDTTAIAPATGPLVDDAVFSFHLPADAEWELSRGGLSATTYDEDLNPFRVAVSVVPLLSGGTAQTLDDDYELSTDQDPYDLKRGENRVIDGIEGWTAQSVEEGQLIYEFGTMHSDKSFSLTFRFPQKDPRTLGWIEAILASIAWK
ncbi:hypothetical protein ACOACQ_07795 [Nocardioides sp. CPCC 206347]